MVGGLFHFAAMFFFAPKVANTISKIVKIIRLIRFLFMWC